MYLGLLLGEISYYHYSVTEIPCKTLNLLLPLFSYWQFTQCPSHLSHILLFCAFGKLPTAISAIFQAKSCRRLGGGREEVRALNGFPRAALGQWLMGVDTQMPNLSCLSDRIIVFPSVSLWTRLLPGYCTLFNVCLLFSISLSFLLGFFHFSNQLLELEYLLLSLILGEPMWSHFLEKK